MQVERMNGASNSNANKMVNFFSPFHLHLINSLRLTLKSITQILTLHL